MEQSLRTAEVREKGIRVAPTCDYNLLAQECASLCEPDGNNLVMNGFVGRARAGALSHELTAHNISLW